jgi:hypothetical protein
VSLADTTLLIADSSRVMLDEIRRIALRLLSERVTPGLPNGRGFLIDFGLWTSNPSYAYAGCSTRQPLPSQPCPIDSVATDASHALRWPWWLESFSHSWPRGAAERTSIDRYQHSLAEQFAERVLYFDPEGRPLTRTYMDGRDGWYRFREFPAHPWGHGPSTLTGSMRYGSWALLAPTSPPIATAYQRICAIFVSQSAVDRSFRTAYYGSPSTKPELGGLGEVDLYGPSSLYAFICRAGAQLGQYGLDATRH